MISERPDHRSVWVLDTRILGRRPGSYKLLHFEAPVKDPIGLDVLAVPTGHEVALDIRLESVTEGVLVSGTATAVAHGECARCLTPVAVQVRARLRELFAYPGSATDKTTDVDELPRVIDDLIDLLPLVRDEIIVELPLVPLCTPICGGLCADCGERLDELEGGHSHEILDPRWAALAERFSSEGVTVPPSSATSKNGLKEK